MRNLLIFNISIWRNLAVYQLPANNSLYFDVSDNCPILPLLSPNQEATKL